MIELIIEVAFLYILRYPGVLIRWVFYRGKKSIRMLLNDKDPNINTSLSLLVIILISIITLLIEKNCIFNF
jgi:hypothetical protein